MQERKYKSDSEIQFFENDILDNKSKTRYLSMVLLWIKNSQVRKNLQGIFALLFISIALFGFAYLIHNMISTPSEKQIVLRSNYAKASQSLTPEKVTNFFNNQKEFYIKTIETHLSLQNSLTLEELKTVPNLFGRNSAYQILEGNILTNTDRTLFLLQQISNPEMIKTLNSDELEIYNILTLLIEQNNFETTKITGSNMAKIIQNNKIMQNILNTRTKKTQEEVLSKIKSTHNA